jgi:hypothetical protein
MSFQIFSESLFTDCPTIRCCEGWTTASVVEQAISKDMLNQCNYQNSGHYPSSSFLFKTRRSGN